ncbi:MAG: pyridoxal phosphate-dependent aminotransferase [Desulfomonile tiedjei]|uniref:Aminotransferase n=1 Tax=Desulfomonile tiedjei TaxID=2358 RepID=A0A9D6V7E2_9BACT|nr:pyridoxal phosphate-dependent aminotransferase [Desulfomonile tiedjei]
MSRILSKRANELKPSATLAISAKEKELKSQGLDVVGFGAGEPDFTTPSHIRDAAKKSLDRGETFYTPVGGIVDLKKAVVSRLAQDYGLEYKPSEIVISCGAKHSLYNIFQAVVDPDDEVIVFAPYWVSYPEMVALAGGAAVIVPSSEGNRFIPEISELEKRVTEKTKAILLNSPSNPTGVVYPLEVLENIASVADKHDLIVISDEIYDKLLYDGNTFVPFASLPGMKDRTIMVNGVSKTYAMTGLRIGYLASTNSALVKAATDIQSQSTSNPNNTAQAAAVEALNGPQDEVGRMREIFQHRRDLMLRGIDEIPGLSAVKPDGAFYVFVNTSRFYGEYGIENSTDFSKYLLERHYLACVPGGPFGSEDHIRLSFATSEETILKGLGRLRKACEELA